MPRPKSSTAWRLVPLVAVVAIFGRVGWFPFVEWDDAKYLRGNPLIAGPFNAVNLIDYLFTPQMGYVVPVTVALERLLYLIGGGAAWPFHVVAVSLHGANALLLARVIEKLGAGPKTAAVGALLWACHPIVAEPVSWATGLKDVLALTLTLGCVLAYLAGQGGRAVLLGALAFFSKPTTVLLPAALLLLPDRQRRVLGGLGLAALVAGALSFVMRSVQIGDGAGVVAPAAAAKGGTAAHPLVVFVSQIENYLAPLDLHPTYAVTNISFYYWVVGVAFIAATLALLRVWDGPKRFALGFAIAAYLPSSQLIPFPRSMADSFLYAPSVGVWIIVALLLPGPLLRALEPLRVRRPQLLGTALLVALALSLASWRQTARWRSNEALWMPLVQAEPGWAYPHILLAQGYAAEGRFHEAAYLYEQAFARQYAPQYLSAYGEALYADWRFADARCVFEEDVLFGVTDNARARRNLTKFWQLVNGSVWNGELAPRKERQCPALQRPIERIGTTQTGK